MTGNKKAGYSNDQAIETRTVDAVAAEVAEKEQVGLRNEECSTAEKAVEKHEDKADVEGTDKDCDKQELEPSEDGTRK